MTRRLPLLIGVLIVAAAGWWFFQRRDAASPAPAATAATAPTAVLGIRLDVTWAGPNDDALAVIRMGDAGTARRQALEATEKAVGRQYKGAARERTLTTPVATPPENWATLVRLAATANGATTAATVTPAATTEPGAAMFVFRAGAGVTLQASLPFDGGTVTSNVVTLKAPEPGPARAIAQGRVAEMLKRGDGIAAASRALLGDDARSAWGHFFNGAALELSGDKPGAVAAYRRALEFSPSSYEPPVALLDRIARLSAK